MACVISTTECNLLHVEQIGSDAGLDALRDGWNHLAGSVPFRRFEWLATWWRHYQQPQWKLFVLAVRDLEGELVGLMPLYWSQSFREGRVLRFLGSGEVCSDYLTLLTVEGLESHVAAHVADWLVGEAGTQWDSLELVGLDAADATASMLAERFKLHGYRVYSHPGQNCWRLEFPGTWDDYLLSLSKSRRDGVRKLLRRVFHTGRATTGIVEDHEELERYFPRLVELHQKRRVRLGQPGCFASHQFTEFHYDVMRQMLALGLLRLSWTDFDGCPAAIEYALVGGATVYFYQGGIEPVLIKQQPGWLSTIGSLRDAHDQGFRYFDFLRGDEAYKSSWGATSRPAIELRIVAPRFVPRLRYGAWRARKLMGRLKRALQKCGPDVRSAAPYDSDRHATTHVN